MVYSDATEWLTSYLAGFDESLVYNSPFTEFGALLWHDPSTVITFNYDCMLEYALANASGVNRGSIPRHSDRSSDAALTYSHYNWNPARAYGIRFEEVEPSRAGGGDAIPGETFYEHAGNDLYTTPILKLHGSLNWFRYVPVRAFPANTQDDSLAPKGSILVRRSYSTPMGNMHNGWLTERELITPVLYKQELLQNEKFELLWQRAFEELSGCRRLVVVGYSFPPTDFATKRLFLETFAGRPPLDELTVVNPNPTLLPLIRQLTQHTGSIRSLNTLEDYVASCT